MNIKKRLLIISAMLFGVSASAQLNGSYTIGTSGTYATIQEACTDLEAQGQDGPVVFDIESSDTPYMESITLNAVSGNSATNTITFQSALLDSSTVHVESMSEHTFSFNDVSFVNFNQIALAYVNSEGSGKVVNVENGTDYSFDHVQFVQNASADAVYMNKDNSMYNISFMDCDIISESNGIILASDNGSVENISMTNSSISNTNSMCFYVSTEYHITEATFSNSEFNSTNGSGIIFYTYAGDITEVTLTDCEINTRNDGFYLEAEMAANNITIENNSISTNIENFESVYPRPIQIEGQYGGIDNVNVNNNYLEAGIDYSYEAIYINSGDAQVNNINVMNNEINSGRYGIYFYCYGGINWLFDNNDIDVQYDGIYVDCYGPMLNTTLTNNEAIVSNGDGIYLYADANINNFVATENTVDSNGDGLYLEAYGGGFLNCLITDNEIVSSNDAGIYLESNANIYDVDLINNDIESLHSGIYMESDDANIENINIIDNDLVTDYYGIYIEAVANVSNLVMNDNEVLSSDEAVYLYPEYGGLYTATINDNTFESTGDNAFYLYSDAGITDFSYTNNSTIGLYEAVYIESYYDGISNVEISDNYIYSTDDYGLYMESGYAPFESILVTNNEIYADTVDSFYSAIYMEADDSYMDNVNITNNDLYSYGSGMDIEADYGNALNSSFDNNNIWAGDYGIDIDGFGENSSISRNNIYPIEAFGTYTYTGINVYGYDGPSSGASINGNYLENISDYGIYADYMDGLEVQRNIINGMEASDNLYGIYLQDCYGANTVINANQILTVEERTGIYFDYSVFDPNSPASVTNNFITNMEYSFYTDNAGNINFANNSMASSNNFNMAYIYDCTELTFVNNIFRETQNTGSIYYLDNTSGIMMDNNVYDFDDTAINFVEGVDYGTVSTLADFQAASAMEAASFELDLSSIFVNDDNDLHIDCATTSLSLGISLPYVMDDVEGTLRPSSDVTIGAHEVNSATPDILSESVLMCSEVEIIMMNPVSGTYLWNTSETTPSITVNEPGTYSVTVTDNCGNTHSDEITVYVDAPDASFLAGSASLTGLFSNTSVGGTSYEWDFGDGETSTEENPTHLYEEEGTYTVTLTVTDECGNISTAERTLEINFVSVNEWLNEEDINVYPNPTNGLVNIEFNQLTGETVTIVVMDLDGRTVFSDQIVLISGGNRMNLDLSNYADGMYIFMMQSDTAKITKKVIKN